MIRLNSKKPYLCFCTTFQDDQQDLYPVRQAADGTFPRNLHLLYPSIAQYYKFHSSSALQSIYEKGHGYCTTILGYNLAESCSFSVRNGLWPQ
jgi:hypothetical protein